MQIALKGHLWTAVTFGRQSSTILIISNKIRVNSRQMKTNNEITPNYLRAPERESEQKQVDLGEKMKLEETSWHR